jgi:hypothetical protein
MIGLIETVAAGAVRHLSIVTTGQLIDESAGAV